MQLQAKHSYWTSPLRSTLRLVSLLLHDLGKTVPHKLSPPLVHGNAAHPSSDLDLCCGDDHFVLIDGYHEVVLC